MQLRHEQLAAQLAKPLAPLYWISGDVPFLVLEASDLIRTTATQQGFNERVIFHVEKSFAWENFLHHANTFSLFASKQLLELRLYQTLSDAGKKALQAYMKQPAKDKVILISSAKLETATQKTAWFQSITQAGIFIPVWPIPVENLPRWIAARAAAKNLQLDSQAVTLLASLGEGNLLAIAQEIEKLELIYHKQGEDIKITADMALQAISDQARFDIFQLSDAVLQNNSQRVLRILSMLQNEGAEAVLVLWVLTREIRTLLTICYALTEGISLDQAMQKQRIWDKQKAWISKTLQRHTIKSLQLLLQHAGKIDSIIKGVTSGNVWDELQKLGVTICSKNP